MARIAKELASGKCLTDSWLIRSVRECMIRRCETQITANEAHFENFLSIATYLYFVIQLQFLYNKGNFAHCYLFLRHGHKAITLSWSHFRLEFLCYSCSSWLERPTRDIWTWIFESPCIYIYTLDRSIMWVKKLGKITDNNM